MPGTRQTLLHPSAARCPDPCKRMHVACLQPLWYLVKPQSSSSTQQQGSSGPAAAPGTLRQDSPPKQASSRLTAQPAWQQHLGGCWWQLSCCWLCSRQQCAPRKPQTGKAKSCGRWGSGSAAALQPPPLQPWAGQMVATPATAGRGSHATARALSPACEFFARCCQGGAAGTGVNPTSWAQAKQAAQLGRRCSIPHSKPSSS